MSPWALWGGCVSGLVLFLCASQANSADSQSPHADTPGTTISCGDLLGPLAVVKAAFEYRAVRAVQYLDAYVKQLTRSIDTWKADPTRVAKVCRLYALDELADIYTTQLVQFDLANQRNTEADRLLKEMNCCRASHYFTGTFYPPNRLVYSFLYAPGLGEEGFKPSLFPDSILAEVAARDVENVRRRIAERQLLLDSIFNRSRSPVSVHQKEGKTTIAMKELALWRETLQLDPSLSESAKALILHDRIWSLRDHIDDTTWRLLVIESGKAALADVQVADTVSPRVGVLLRFQLGYVYMQNGQRDEGTRMYEEMLRKVALYQKVLEDNYSKVQWAQTKERMSSRAKTAVAATLTGLSFGVAVAGELAAIYVPRTPIGGNLVDLWRAWAIDSMKAYGITVAAGALSHAANAANPGVENSIQEFEYARLKSLETAKLFGESPQALPLIFNEHERLALHRDLGRAFEHQKQIRQAIDHYKNAIEIIEHERAGLGKESTRFSFLEGKEEVYGRLIPLLVKEGDLASAFEYAERARSRNFVDVLASGRPHFRTSQESAVFTERQREQAEVELAVQRSGLARIEIEELRRSVRGVQLVAGKASPTSAHEQTKTAATSNLTVEFDSLTAVNTASINEIDTQLGRQAALLAFHVGDDATTVFLLQDGTVSAWVRPIGRQTLQRQVEAFRRLIQHNPKSQGSDVAALQKAGQELHRILLHEAMQAVRRPVVYISPQGPLHYLPFAAVHDGSQYLVDRVTLVTAPSGTVLTYLARKPRASTGKTVVMANPDLGSSIYDLPFAEQEGDRVKNRRPGATLLKRKDAQEIKIRELGPQASVLHFATHGKFYAVRPLESALLLAPGGGEDGTLTASEIFSLGLSGSLVVLSACETGLGQLATGDEILGLTRAFMYAGAPQLIATLWEIDDQATSELMDQLYAGLENNPAPTALRAAQQKVRSRYPHPFYWAGFVSHGLHE